MTTRVLAGVPRSPRGVVSRLRIGPAEVAADTGAASLPELVSARRLLLRASVRRLCCGAWAWLAALRLAGS